jgi:hypothetical protein
MGYFTDRNLGPLPRVSTELGEAVRRGIVGLLRTRTQDGSFGLEYPEQCSDGRGPTGTDTNTLRDVLAGYRLFNFLDGGELPSTHETLDLIEFTYNKVAQPHHGTYHEFYDHYHLWFSQDEGRARFREEVSRLFERNGIAFDLQETGRIERIAPEGVRDILTQAVFHTEDEGLDQLLERARARFLDRNPAVRRESLETLWDAWERLKSLEGGDKRASTTLILDKAAAEPNFRGLLENEARVLTDIGNHFMIRHAEINKTPIVDEEHVDFLFHRLFSVIRLLLKKSNRGG